MSSGDPTPPSSIDSVHALCAQTLVGSVTHTYSLAAPVTSQVMVAPVLSPK